MSNTVNRAVTALTLGAIVVGGVAVYQCGQRNGGDYSLTSIGECLVGGIWDTAKQLTRSEVDSLQTKYGASTRPVKGDSCAKYVTWLADASTPFSSTTQMIDKTVAQAYVAWLANGAIESKCPFTQETLNAWEYRAYNSDDTLALQTMWK